MYAHIRRYINGCQECQFHNKRSTAVPGPMQLVTPPVVPFHRIGVDFIGPFPITKNRNVYIFVAIDHTTRYMEAWPVSAATTKCATSVLERCIIHRHSCPKEILCDRGSAFTSHEFLKFADKFHIKILYTTSYHPNTNGVTERANSTLKRIVSKFVNDKHKDWDQYVARAAFAMNSTIHSVNLKSPYFLLYGREPCIPCDNQLPTLDDYVDDEDPESHGKRAAAGQKEARMRTIEHQRASKRRFDKNHPDVTYKPGDLVLIANFARTVGKVSKWLSKWYGPFQIVKPMGPINYIVEDLRPDANKILRNVSVRHLKPYYKEFVSQTDAESSESSGTDENDPTVTSLAASISYKSRKSHTTQNSVIAPSMVAAANSHFSPVQSCSQSANPQSTLVAPENSSSISFHTLPTSNSYTTAESINSSSSESTVDTSEPRRSTRTRKTVDRYGDYDLPYYKTSSKKSRRK